MGKPWDKFGVWWAVPAEVRNAAGEVGLCVLPPLSPQCCYERGCIVISTVWCAPTAAIPSPSKSRSLFLPVRSNCSMFQHGLFS
jgi:hypothetical protein